jgi:hypothetical protein
VTILHSTTYYNDETKMPLVKKIIHEAEMSMAALPLPHRDRRGGGGTVAAGF